MFWSLIGLAALVITALAGIISYVFFLVVLLCSYIFLFFPMTFPINVFTQSLMEVLEKAGTSMIKPN